MVSSSVTTAGECGVEADLLTERKRLQQRNERLKRSVSDLTLGKLISTGAVRGTISAPLAAGPALIMSRVSPSVSQRRACQVLRQHHSTQRKLPREPPHKTPMREGIPLA